MRRVHGLLLLLTAAGIATGPAAAEPAPSDPLTRLLPWARFDPAVPSPEKAAGAAPASRPLLPEEIVRYFEALAATSPRARLIEYARSYEGRPLVALAVSDEATIARLDEFRREHARRMDPRGRAASDDASALRDAKAVAWMAYGIHGDELSSSDAAVTLAYWLVAGEDDRARALRDGLVVLIDPSENPDGRARFLAQTASFAHFEPSPDTEDLSHTSVWPWGRGNHYLFDVNRDWLSQVHPESRQASAIASWNPQLLVDSHEMGADDTYLFSPARPPFNPLKPEYLAAWADLFSADQARALDERGYAYYRREWNEEFFPGYGSSWASYLGAVGILYEMGGVEGTLVRQRAGTVRTYLETVEHQLTSSVANLETLLANRARFLAEFAAARRDAIRRGTEGPIRAWLLPPGRYPDRADRLARVLRAQGIEVRRAGSAVKVAGLRDARTGGAGPSELPVGTWMVPLDQPAAPLARAILDPHVPMEATFLREEREYLERGKGTRLYDATAWSLPLAYGLDAYWTGARPDGDWRDDEPPAPEGGLDRADAGFGWLADGASEAAVSALADLLEGGIAVRVAEKPFRAAGTSFDRGAILVRREGNPQDVAVRLDEIGRRRGTRFRGTSTARSEEGPDLGGNHFRPLVPPRVGIFAGQGVSPSAYGALWHLLDREVELRFTGLDVSRFDGIDLARYNVLVFPPTFFAGYRARLGKEGIDRLRRWIEAGGTAIGIGDGAAFLADPAVDLTKARMRSTALDRFPPVVYGISAEEAERAGLFRAGGLRPEPEVPRADPKPPGAPVPKAESRRSPYDVAPVLGPGAKPFAEGSDLGTPVTTRPRDLAAWLKPLLPPGREKPEAAELERADERLRRFSPRGAFLAADLDPENWLSWGAGTEVPVWLDARDTLVADAPVEVPARFAPLERLHLGGLLWPEAAGRLSLTAYAAREAVGRGQVVLFLDEPAFRGWTLATRRLLTNAILYGPGLGSRWSTPW